MFDSGQKPPIRIQQPVCSSIQRVARKSSPLTSHTSSKTKSCANDCETFTMLLRETRRVMCRLAFAIRENILCTRKISQSAFLVKVSKTSLLLEKVAIFYRRRCEKGSFG